MGSCFVALRLGRDLTRGGPIFGPFRFPVTDAKRFGLIFVDYGTQRRIPKRSAGWFADVAGNNSIPAD